VLVGIKQSIKKEKEVTQMQQQYVYRMENKDGRGPYNTIPLEYWVSSDHNDFSHPNPEEDYLGRALSHYKLIHGDQNVLFGCLTLRSIRKWFTFRERRSLRGHGFTIKKVPARVIAIGKSQRQCIFVREEVKKK
jgi:hypothetical protein